MTDEKLKIAIHIVAKIAIINYEYETKDKNFDFIHKRIKKMSRIASLIFIEIINICFNKDDNNTNIEVNENKIIEEKDIDKDYNEMKKYIFEEFLNNLNIDNIIKFLDCLEQKKITNGTNEKEPIINEFLSKLIEKYLFTKDEFFSYNKTLKFYYSINYMEKEKYKEKKNIMKR